MTGRGVLFIAALTALWSTGASVITLELESAAYLPWDYAAIPLYEYNKDAAVKSAYGANNKLYVVGSNILHVLSIAEVDSPVVVFSQKFLNGFASDVAVCGSYVAATFHNHEWPLDGKVFVYRIYDDESGFQLSKAHEIAVGANPSSLRFNSACTLIVVTVGGEPVVHAGTLVNPEGAIGFIQWPSTDLSQPYTLKEATFIKFNERANEYTARGVRWVYRGHDNVLPTTFSQDLEPQSIIFSSDQSTAYVLLQENNAIAKVNISAADVVELYPIGTKNWNLTGYDPSDRDGGFHVEPYGTHSFYQPAAGVLFIVSAADHIMFVNQGAWKTYTTPTFPSNWTEVKRGTEFVEEDLLDPSVDPGLRSQLLDDRFLGRLYLSKIDGKTEAGKFNTFYSYGGRDMAFWRTEDSKLLYDTGSAIEQAIGQNFASVFNSDPKQSQISPVDAKDLCSPDRGPEPNAIAGANIENKLVFFVANGRPGVVTIHSLPVTGSGIPQLESVHYNGGTSGRTWEQFYEDRESWDVGASDVDFIDEISSPNGANLLVVTGRMSGSISIYRVVERENPSPTRPKMRGRRVFDPRFPSQFRYFQEDMGVIIVTNPLFIGLVVVVVLFSAFALIAYSLKYFHQRKMRRLAEQQRNNPDMVEVQPQLAIIQP